MTLSEAGQDAFNPQADAGPNVDANGVVVWTRSDGSNLRVQSARRRDVVGFPRPKGASPMRASRWCRPTTSAPPANRTHGPSLVFPSCNPPVALVCVLTVGTPDANGFAANSVSSVRFKAVAGNPATEANEADVACDRQDRRRAQQPEPCTDYTGSLVAISVNLQITDHRNADGAAGAGTVQAFPLDWSVQCVGDGRHHQGRDCNATTSINALLPGAVLESKRTIWELGQVVVKDAGAERHRLRRLPADLRRRRRDDVHAPGHLRPLDAQGPSKRPWRAPAGRPQVFLRPRVMGPGRRRYPFDHPRGSRGSFLYLDRLGPADRLDPEEWLAEKYESR